MCSVKRGASRHANDSSFHTEGLVRSASWGASGRSGVPNRMGLACVALAGIFSQPIASRMIFHLILKRR